MLRTLLAVAGVSLFALAGCGGSTGPVPLTGTFTLVRVSGEAPPHVFEVRSVTTAAGPAFLHHSIDGGSVRLRPDGAASLTLSATERLVSANDGSVLSERQASDRIDGVLEGASIAFGTDTLRLPVGPLGVAGSMVTRSAIDLRLGRIGLLLALRFEP